MTKFGFAKPNVGHSMAQSRLVDPKGAAAVLRKGIRTQSLLEQANKKHFNQT